MHTQSHTKYFLVSLLCFLLYFEFDNLIPVCSAILLIRYVLCVANFDAILWHLGTDISGGSEAMEYILGIDPTRYAWHAFPLPRMCKVSSNPMEQANSEFLPIRQFAPLKHLIERWFYLLTEFNEWWEEVANRIEVLMDPAHRSHMANLRSFG